MKRSPKILVHLLLDAATMTPPELGATLSRVLSNAPSCALYKNDPAIQTAVIELGQQGATFNAAVDAASATGGLLTSLRANLAAATAAADRGLILLKDVVENKATTAAEVSAVGFLVRERATAGDPIAAPDGVTVKLSKTHGKFAVTVYDLRRRGHFAAQMSVDPIGANTWTDLPGNGKRRKLSGQTSGTTVWVRFAALRGQTRGAWGTPVAVTVP